MNDDLFINSGRIVEQNWELIFAILICVAWGTLLIFAILKKTTTQYFTDTELITLAFSGWPLPALLISILILYLQTIINTDFVFVISLTLIVVSTLLAIRSTSLGVISPVLIFLVFVFVRLGFVANTILPLYFDSAEHYRIIQSIMQAYEVGNFIWPLTSYYHIGYHVIIAGFTLITHADPGRVILIFGQIILAAIPLPMYFFVRRATGSDSAAVFGVMLAAFGWFMPAHAINWGKYPALLSLLVIQFTLGVVFTKKHLFFMLSALISIVIHTRAIILISIFGLSWMISAVWESQTQTRRILLLALTGALLGMTILLIKQNQIIAPILEPYLNWVTLLVGLLSALVFQSFPRLTFISILSILLMLVGMFIPLTSMLTLLDRPLVEMTLFLPLAFLGGLGAARLPKFVVMIFAISIIIHALITYNFYPSDCCQLVQRDDVVALDWIDKNLPEDSRIAIASADLGLNAFGVPMQGTGTDAGIWVTPLTQHSVLNLPYSTDFTSQNTYTLLCGKSGTYIYIGWKPQSFNYDLVTIKPEWYKTIFFLPNAHIVQVLNCEHGN